MGTILDFTVDAADGKPIVFTIRGKDLLERDWSETFTCVTPIPSHAISLFMAAVGIDEDGNRVESAPNLERLIEDVLREWQVVETLSEDGGAPTRTLEPADDVTRFKALIRDKIRIVSLDALGKVAVAIMEEASGRSFG